MLPQGLSTLGWFAVVSSLTRSAKMPRLPMALPFRWEQGEHVAVIGDTGTGKSTLMTRLLLSRRYTLAVKTKRDPIQFPGKLAKELGRARGNLNLNDPREDRWVLDLSSGKDIATFRTMQRRELTNLFDAVWDRGGWAVLLDETFYIDNILKLRDPLQAMLTQGRSMGITLMMGIQRPVDVTRFVMSSAAHTIVYRQDGRDIETVAKATTAAIKPHLADLDRYEFVWFNRITRQIWRGRLDLDGNQLIGEMVA